MNDYRSMAAKVDGQKEDKDPPVAAIDLRRRIDSFHKKVSIHVDEMA